MPEDEQDQNPLHLAVGVGVSLVVGLWLLWATLKAISMIYQLF